jgi:glucose dehydrogenase
MRHNGQTVSSAVVVAVFATLLFTVMVLAASEGFSIDWWTVDGGGGTSQGGDYAVSGTIGQPDAGSPMSGGDYTIVGGFWSGASAPPSSNLVYLPLVMR